MDRWVAVMFKRWGMPPDVTRRQTLRDLMLLQHCAEAEEHD